MSVTNLTNTTWNLDTTALNNLLSQRDGVSRNYNLTFTHSDVEYIKFHYDDIDWHGRVEFTKSDLSVYRLVDDLEWKSTNRIITIIGGSDVESLGALEFFNTYCEQILGFNVTYEENGGTTQTDLTDQTALPSTLPIPTKSGYLFGGWYYESSFTTRAYANDTLSANVTLYAKWYKDDVFSEVVLSTNETKNLIKAILTANGVTMTSIPFTLYPDEVKKLLDS